MATNKLSPADYVVFALVLVISTAIGIFYGIRQRGKSATELLLGGRSMSILPVTLSLTASFMSAITLLGTPAEIYTFTTLYFWLVMAFIISIPISAHVFIPVFYNLQLTSIFEYLQHRFGTFIRLSMVIIYIIQIVLYTAIVLYAPSLALQAVTGLNVWISVLSVGVVCTFYTTIGGMKAVLWTDAFQMIIMVVGLIAILIQGTRDHHGFSNIWNDMINSGRVEWINFDPDPTVRHTVWSLVIGGCMVWLPVYGANQAQIQRALSLPSLRKAQIAYWINVPCLVGLVIICGCCGMVCYAQYKDCDPIRQGRISSKDQLLPLYVMDSLAHLPGIPGLFIASLFSGTLSTISSSLNSLSAVTLQDLIRPFCCPNITDARASLATKILALVYGAICIALTFLAAKLGGVLQAAMGLFGMIGGPQLGVFMLGILFPCVNNIGAIAGFFSGLILTLWVGMGAQVYKDKLKAYPSPVSTTGCPADNATLWNVTTQVISFSTTDITDSMYSWTTAASQISDKSGFLVIYSVSYLWYGVIAVVVVCFVGITVSVITNCFKKHQKVDPKLTNPILSKLTPCLPESIRKWLSCYSYTKEDEEMEDVIKTKKNGIIQNNIAYLCEEAPPPYYITKPYIHPLSQHTHV